MGGASKVLLVFYAFIICAFFSLYILWVCMTTSKQIACARIFSEAPFISNNSKQLSNNRELVKIKYGLYVLQNNVHPLVLKFKSLTMGKDKINIYIISAV